MPPTDDPEATAPDSRPSSSSSLHGRFDPGTKLGSRYRVVGLLGRGGMGEVYRADDLELNQSVALKFLPERLAQNPTDLARLRQEVRVARQIAHPNVCRTYDLADVGGEYFVVMEYVDGEDLASVLRRLGRPTPDKAVEIARSICLGLGAAHENGVLHRDLKPANIMIDGRGRVRITDFGLAGTAEDVASRRAIEGTPAYMAPEQAQSGVTTVATDIYALGLVLYEVFTGKRAADSGLRAGAETDSDSGVRTPSSLVAGIDPAVERIILQCLHRSPARRPHSAYAVFGALPGGDPLAAAVAAGETPSPELVANAGVEGSMRPLWAGIAVFVAIAAFVALAWIQKPLYEDFGRPPRRLSARADEIMADVTGKQPPRYTAEGMRYAPAPPDSGSRAKTAPAKQYWRRWSPTLLAPTQFHAPSPSIDDPPQVVPGSGTVVLDMEGRLVALSVVPSPRDSAVVPAGWDTIVRAAGRSEAGVGPAPVPRDFARFADSAAAWSWGDSTRSDTTLAAARLGGRWVRVDTFAGRNPLGSLAVVDVARPRTGDHWTGLLLLNVIPILGSIPLARRNLRTGRSDIRGAAVVGVTVFTLYMLEHLFGQNLSEFDFYEVLNSMTNAIPIGHATFHGAVMALFYLAIEPYVRRLWPSVLVSWARLVAGRVRDPIVGRDVLVGAATGAVAQLILLSAGYVARALGLSHEPARIGDFAINAMVGASSTVMTLCYLLAISLLLATSTFTLLVILRFLLRHNLAAVIGVVIIMALSGGLTDAPWIALAFGIVAGSLMATVGLRFGYVALFIAILTINAGGDLVWTLDFGSWFAQSALFSWGLLLVILGYGFATAVAGRSIFHDPLGVP